MKNREKRIACNRLLKLKFMVKKIKVVISCGNDYIINANFRFILLFFFKKKINFIL